MILLTALLAQPAHACGGFFCNRDQPVDQSGETIVFEVDEEEERVTMHVQVDYEGPSESFAWVVPVSGVPDLFRSHEALFTAMTNLTLPSFGIQFDNERCEDGYSYAYDDADASYSSSYSFADTAAPPSGGGVQVLDTNRVASYDAVTLAADDSDALVAWLQENDYDLPDQMSEALAPYVAGGMNFVAIKLVKDADVGDLAPLAMRYEGTTPAVPLTITSIAATDDMPMTVYLLGEARGVPLNYLHVGLNPLAIDYWTGGSNIDDVISRAADEAGGHGFATEAAAELSRVDGLLYSEGMFDTSILRGLGPSEFVQALPNAGFWGTPEVLDVLRDFIPVPDSFPYDEQTFYNEPVYYQEYYDLIEDFDADAAIEALEDAEVEPREAAQAMLTRSSWLTRLRSSVSPYEMTLDPHFGFNRDLPPAEAIGWMEVERLCNELVTTWRDAPQRLLYPYGQTLTIPSETDLQNRGITAFEFVQEHSDFAALWIEKMDTQGPPERLTDRTSQELPDTTAGTDATDGLAAEGGEAEASGCGCSSTSLGGSLWLPLLGWLAVGRR